MLMLDVLLRNEMIHGCSATAVDLGTYVGPLL
jgi:hypothetical protein